MDFLLTEAYSAQRIKDQFKKFISNNKDVIDELFGDEDKFINELEKLDPNNGSENVVTMLLWLKNNVIDFDDIKNGTIDFKYNETDEIIVMPIKNIFEMYAKHKNKLPTEYKDIRETTKRNILFLMNFLNALYTFYIIDNERNEKDKKGEGTILYTGPNGTRFFESYDVTHSCYIGRGTKWCTAATISKNYFEHYKESGYRIITMIPKNPDMNGREKYQFNFFSWYDSGQIRTIFPEIQIFNYLNKVVKLENLQNELYEDFIHFMFKLLKEEVEFKLEVEDLDLPSLETVIIFMNFMTNMIRYRESNDARVAFDILQQIIEIKNFKFSTLSINKFKELCLIKPMFFSIFTSKEPTRFLVYTYENIKILSNLYERYRLNRPVTASSPKTLEEIFYYSLQTNDVLLFVKALLTMLDYSFNLTKKITLDDLNGLAI